MKAMVKETAETVEIKAAEALFTIEKSSGALVSWKVKGEELLYRALEPYFWKPANDVQIRNGYLERLSVWKNVEQKRVVKNIVTDIHYGKVMVDVIMYLPQVGAGYNLRYTVNGKGNI